MIESFENADALAQAAAAAIAQALDEAVQANGRALFIATGGHTPGAAYDRLFTAAWARLGQGHGDPDGRALGGRGRSGQQRAPGA